MTLEKAIEECQRVLNKQFHLLTPAAIVAIKLGIEALREVERWRKFSPTMIGMRLPGETKEK